MASIAAIAVASALDLPLDADRISAALMTDAAPDDGRLAPRVRADGTVVLDDAYNANGASMLASLRAASEIAEGMHRGLVLVLGEMRELGELSGEEHQRVADEAARVHPRALLAVQGDAKRFSDTARLSDIESYYLDTASEAAKVAKNVVRAGDVVLVKGSRGVGLEAVVSALREVAG
jgi:UDP-N-acetylmuramoyl-tripeptide--D-alanyl-D-alanine ligase